MANINSQWRRFMAVGCVHGAYACREAQDLVIGFRERWQPETVIDLGDLHDMAAFRSGASGTKDEAADIGLDFDAGVDWLRRYRPTHRTNGNHDNRLVKLVGHPKAIISHLSGKIIQDIAEVDEENGTLVKPYSMVNGWWTFGDTRFGHGWMYSEQAGRDHAEAFGKCVIAHTHTTGQANSRSLNPATCWMVGTMCNPEEMTYAHERRAWLRWGHGMAWGEYNDNFCQVYLTDWKCQHHTGPIENPRFPL